MDRTAAEEILTKEAILPVTTGKLPASSHLYCFRISFAQVKCGEDYATYSIDISFHSTAEISEIYNPISVLLPVLSCAIFSKSRAGTSRISNMVLRGY